MTKNLRTVIPILAMLLAGCTTGSPPPAPTGLGQPTPTFPPLPGSTGVPAETIPGDGTAQAAGSQNPLDGLNFRDGWARIPFNINVFGGLGADQMNDVTGGGPGAVAVGFTARGGEIDGAVWFTRDAVTWARVDRSPDLGGEGQQTLNAIVQGPAGFVAVGMEQIGEDTDAAVWFSPDGIEWSRVGEGNAAFGDGESQVMNNVAAVGSGFVAVGVEETEEEVRGAVWTSPDGSNWQRAPHAEAVFGGVGRFVTLDGIAALGDELVAVGSLQPIDVLDVDVGVWVSTDGGGTWTPVEAPERSLGDGAGGVRFQIAAGIAAGPSGLIVAATEQNLAGSPSGEFINALILSSADGLAWERIYDHKPDLYQQTMLDIVSTTLGFYIGGYDVIGDQSQAAVWFSPDGSGWSQAPHAEIVFGGPGFQRITALAEAGPGIVAVGATTENGDQDAAVWIFVPGR